MAGKHDTYESARRPLALHKLSGLINRGASKSKKAPEPAPPAHVAAPAVAPGAGAGAPAAPQAAAHAAHAAPADKAASLFRLKARRKDPSPDSGPKFRPLEVDLNTLSSYRLSDGWLDDKKPQKPDQDPESEKENRSPRRSRDRATSSTPIADLYVGQSVRAPSPTSGQSIKGPSQHRGAARPFSFIAAQSPSHGRKSLDKPRNLSSRGGSILDRPRPVEPSESVLERGRPVEPQRITGTQPEDVYRTRSHSRSTNSWRDYMPKQVPQASTATIRMVPSHGNDDDYDPFRSDDSGSVTYDPFRADTMSLSSRSGHLRGRESLDASNRHSMYAVVPSPMSRPGTANRNGPSNRSTSDQPLDRIRTWQKSVTSAPGTGAAPAPGVAPARSLSKRGVGNRLAWIRELEDKKSAGGGGAPAPAPGGFKKPSGSVADRLRMFEVKKQEAAAAAASTAPVVPRLPPLSRTNSTASRLSSVGFDAATSSSACDNATATPRTSIDSVRTSNRTSSVMSYYDPSFREKMEGIVSSYSEKDDETKKQKVKASFVPVMSPKKEETPRPQPEAEAAPAPAEETKAAEDKPEEAVEEKPQPPAEVEKQEEESEAAAPGSEEEVKSEEKAESKPETVEPVAEDKVQPEATPVPAVEAEEAELPQPAAEAEKAAELHEPAVEAEKATELPETVVEAAPAPAVEAPAAAPEPASAPQPVEEAPAAAPSAKIPAPSLHDEAFFDAVDAHAEADKAATPLLAAATARTSVDTAYAPEAEGLAEEIKFFKPEKCTLINE